MNVNVSTNVNANIILRDRSLGSNWNSSFPHVNDVPNLVDKWDREEEPALPAAVEFSHPLDYVTLSLRHDIKDRVLALDWPNVFIIRVAVPSSHD